MKIRRLPELDLAHFAPLPIDLKRRALGNFRMGFPPYSYKPVRSSLSDILNLEAGMFGAIPRVSFENITKQIVQTSKSTKEAQANLQVAEGLFLYSTKHELRGREETFHAMPTRVGEKLVYWMSAVLNVSGRPLIPFINPRRSRLSSESRRFVFSMMHERIRTENPDFKEVQLGIFHFDKSKLGPRTPKLSIDDDIKLYNFDALDRMIAETYEIWNEICEGRIDETRRKYGDRGTLI